jgi:LPS-assembly lipoprotein
MRQLTTIALLACSLLVAGCSSYRPLYGTGTDGKAVSVALSGITVEEQTTRSGQLVRNNLISSFGGGGPTYILRLSPDEKLQEVSSQASKKLSRVRLGLKVKYELADAKSGETLQSGASFSHVSYDTVEQPVADLRAVENARDRAAREVAEDIRVRLAAYFSTAR